MATEFKLIGYDYTNLLHKQVAVDPETKAVLFKSIGGVGFGEFGWVNAEDFGGSNIGAKVNNALADGHTSIIIPGGNYIIAPGDEIFIDASNIRLWGMGKSITRISYEGTGSAIRLKTCKRNDLRAFTLLGNSVGKNGLYLEDVWHAYLSSIAIENFVDYGLSLVTKDNSWGSYYNLFEEVEAIQAKYNLWLGQPGAYGVAINANTFITCKFRTSNYGTGSRNVRLDTNSNENVFILVEMSASQGTGLEILGDRNVFILPYVESCYLGIRNDGGENVILQAVLSGNTTNWQIDQPFKFRLAQTVLPQFGEELIHKGAILRGGTQSEGRCSCYMRDASVYYSEDALAYAYTDFREKMSNTPSSITLSNVGETENYYIKSTSVGHITIYGFDFYAVTSGGSYAFTCGSKKYVTVGN